MTSHMRHGYQEIESVLFVQDDDEECQVQQQFKDSCDINNIMAKYQETGILDHVSNYGPQYGEVDAVTFKEAMDLVASSVTMFEELPAAARDYFNNNPEQFLEYMEGIDQESGDLENDARIQKLRELGLANPAGVQQVNEVDNGSQTERLPTEPAQPAEEGADAEN